MGGTTSKGPFDNCSGCGSGDNSRRAPAAWNPPSSPPLAQSNGVYRSASPQPFDGVVSPSSEAALRPLEKAAVHSFNSGNFGGAKKLIYEIFAKVDEDAELDLGIHVDIASCCINLAVKDGKKGNFEEASHLLEQAMRVWAGPADQQTSSRKPRSPRGRPLPACVDVAKIYDNLGMINYEQGRYSEARDMFAQALDVYRSALAFDDRQEDNALIVDARQNIREMDQLLGRVGGTSNEDSPDARLK